MNPLLRVGIDRLMDEGSYYSAYILTADSIDIRLFCKSFRRKCRVFTGNTECQIVWVRIKDGILMLVSGAPVVGSLLQSFLSAGSFAERKLYRGPGRELFEKKVNVALRGYAKISGRSYGGTR